MSADEPGRDDPGPRGDAAPNADAPDKEELTSPSGTPVAVDITRDLQARTTWVVLLAGPVVWAVHFVVVYLVAEAGCTGSGPGLEAFGPPVPSVVTFVATVVAVLACLGVGGWAWRLRGRGPGGLAADESAAVERNRALMTIGLLLALLSAVAVIFVAAPAVWLPC